MDETLARLDDMRLVAELASAKSFTHVARALGMPKQTVSRRVAAVEEALSVRLVDRTTRTFRVTALGRAYADRCAEIVRLAEEASRAVRGESTEVSGTLRVTADPLFGERFLPPLVEVALREHPGLRVDVMLTSRYVDLVDEGWDVAFRVGTPGDPSLVATRVADASLVLVASPSYLAARGTPRRASDLERHDCIALAPEGAPARWALRDDDAPPGKPPVRWIPIAPRLRVNHHGLARSAALAGLGIANLPSFACREDVERGRLALVLASQLALFGGIFVVHAARAVVTARVRAFRDIAVAHLKGHPDLRQAFAASGKHRARRAINAP